jgi:hypothetical protein
LNSAHRTITPLLYQQQKEGYTSNYKKKEVEMDITRFFGKGAEQETKREGLSEKLDSLTGGRLSSDDLLKINLWIRKGGPISQWSSISRLLLPPQEEAEKETADDKKKGKKNKSSSSTLSQKKKQKSSNLKSSEEEEESAKPEKKKKKDKPDKSSSKESALVAAICEVVPHFPFQTADLVASWAEWTLDALSQLSGVDGSKQKGNNGGTSDDAWTADQNSAVVGIIDFLKGPTTNYGLYGYAGTGKTTLITELIVFLISRKLVRKVAMVAPTNKAVNIIKSRCYSRAAPAILKHIEFLTVHKLLGYENNFTADGARTFVKKKAAKLERFDLIIVDESSMIPSEPAEELLGSPGKKIYAGDLAQLPPVGEPASKLFKDTRISGSTTLSMTVRNTDPNTVALFGAVRKWIESGTMPSWSSYKSPNVIFYGHAKFPKKEGTKWMREFLKPENDTAIILTWTNAQKNSYNAHVRREQFGKADLARFEVGEKLVLNDFYKIPETQTSPMKFYTSEQIEVISVKVAPRPNEQFGDIWPQRPSFGRAAEVERDYRISLGLIRATMSDSYRIWNLKVRKVDAEDAAGQPVGQRTYTIAVLHEDAESARESDRRDAQELIGKLWTTYQRRHREGAQSLFKAVIQPLWTEWNRVFNEPFCSVDYGRCLTVHTSQGSTFPKDAFVDLHDIMLNRNFEEARRCLYTAFTRPRKRLHILL